MFAGSRRSATTDRREVAAARSAIRRGLGRVRRGGDPEFPVDFVLVGVDQELIQELVGPFEFEDAVGGQQGWEAFLAVVVAAAL